MQIRPMLRQVATLALALTTGAAALAQEEGPSAALYDALRMDEFIAVMAEEGVAHGEDVATSMLGTAPPDWSLTVQRIYDADRMEAALRAGLDAALAGVDMTPAIVFFTTEPGRSLLGHEIAARRALLDPDIEAAAQEAAALAMADATPRLELVRRYVEANDLIETNVANGLNSSYRFFMGMMAGGALEQGMTEADILADLWTQEDSYRATTAEWVYSFLLLAYSPVSDADLETYVAFSESPAGVALNAAMFALFEDIYGDISQALGLAVARAAVTQEL